MTSNRRLLLPAISTVLMLAVLIGLGTWQVERLAWKRDLLEQFARAEAEPALPLPPGEKALLLPPFAKVRVAGRFRDDLAVLYAAQGRDTLQGSVMGAQLVVPMERDGAEPVLVERGWVKSGAPLPDDHGITEIEGYIRPGDTASWFSAADDVAGRHFYTLDPQAIGRALGLAHVAPFTIVALGPEPAGDAPDPARHLPELPNNHLTYAITWYGLAVALVVIFLSYARKVARE
jgi:surfeit locus 1 family protein